MTTLKAFDCCLLVAIPFDIKLKLHKQEIRVAPLEQMIAGKCTVANDIRYDSDPRCPAYYGHPRTQLTKTYLLVKLTFHKNNGPSH